MENYRRTKIRLKNPLDFALQRVYWLNQYMMKPNYTSHLRELCTAFAKVRNTREAKAFLKDILTPRELHSVVERLQIVKQLLGGVPHREISTSLKVSIDKITRGARAIRESKGGFSLALWRK